MGNFLLWVEKLWYSWLNFLQAIRAVLWYYVQSSILLRFSFTVYLFLLSKSILKINNVKNKF